MARMIRKEEISQTSAKYENWYDMPNLVDALLFLFPPLGLFALYKTKKIIPEVKVILGLAFFTGIVLCIATF
ncbi:MAG: hypothetical protein M3Q97_01530 [Bacteroidota bacterium]|nr:hypothetical protein [Bacteroidota bacterium]